MIAALMLYGIAIAIFLALAAFVAERACSALGLARRGLWIAAIAGCLLAPLVMIVPAGQTPQEVTTSAREFHLDRNLEPAPAVASVMGAQPIATRMATRFSVPKWNSLLAGFWLAASVTLGGLYVVAWLHAHRKLRACRHDQIAGQAVALSDDIGPAVFGILKPTIIVPRWLNEASHALQSLVLEHERQHIAARDQVLLGFGLLAVIVAPWNLPLWWQLRRLRFAIEVDCDARVLRSGADALSYGEALLHVGRRYVRAPAGAVALIEPPSDLERRIRIMTRDRVRHASLIAIACAATCVSLVGAATQVEPPSVDSRDLQLPPPRASTSERIEDVVREQYPELFDPMPTQPAMVNIVLNNDLSVDWSEKKLLPEGTTQSETESRERPKESLSRHLDADEGRFMGRIVMQTGPGTPPVFVAFAVHVLHESRSPAIVERALRKDFPDLYDQATDGTELLIALMKDDGTVERAIHRPWIAGQSLIGRDNQLRALEELQGGRIDVGVISMIQNRRTAPFKPVVLYAFRRSGNPAIDADPAAPMDLANRRATQRALVERHFPEIADGSSNPHQLLWILLDDRGEVIDTGREATSPEPLRINLERRYPGAATAQSVTADLTGLFGKVMRDEQGQPLLVNFTWVRSEDAARARAPSTASVIALDMTLHRNGELVGTESWSLTPGVAQSYANALLRLDISMVDASKELIDIGVVMQVPVEHKGVDFAPTWELAGKPMVRTRIGEQAIIEQGVRYPGKTGDVIWRIALTPRRTS